MPSLFEYLFRWGGVAGVITLLFGLVTLVASALFMARPREAQVPMLAALGLATAAAGGAGVVTGISMSLTAAQLAGTREDWPAIVLQGVAESMAPGASAFTLVSLSAFLVALGFRRRPASP
jgi:hypothetical protein